MQILHQLRKDFDMEGSLDVVRSDLDLFSEAPVQRMIQKYQYEEIFSFNKPQTDGTITFHVRGSANQWIDLDDTYLMVKYKLQTHGEQDIANDGNTCVQTIEEPNLFHNLWSTVEMSINNTPIKSVVNPYPMRAYIENLLSTPDSGLHEKYVTEGFWKEKAGNFDHVVEDTVPHMDRSAWRNDVQNKNKAGNFDLAIQDTVNNVRTNSAWRKSVQNKNKASPEHVLCGKLAVDMWRQGRNIPPTHDLRLDLTKNRPQFYLRSSKDAGEEHKFIFISMKLIVKRVHLYDDAQADLDRAMKEAGTIKYPIRRVDVKSYAVGTGTKVFQENNIISGQIPHRVIIAMCDNDAMAGTYAKSPFNFKHYNIEELYLMFDGETYPSNMYRTSFANKDAVVPWLNLKRLVTPGQPFFNHTVTYDDFCAGGYTMWVVDMTADNKCAVAADYNNVRKHGDVRLSVRFGGQDGLANPINIVVYAEFENQIEIGQNRDLMQDY